MVRILVLTCLPFQLPQVRFPAFPKNFQRKKFGIDVAEALRKGKCTVVWNVGWTHLILASGKLVLQKITLLIHQSRQKRSWHFVRSDFDLNFFCAWLETLFAANFLKFGLIFSRWFFNLWNGWPLTPRIFNWSNFQLNELKTCSGYY